MIPTAGKLSQLCVVLGLWFLAGWPGAASGAELDYYRAQVPVTSQSPEQRARAASTGLKEVLVRVSGQTDIASAEGVPAELGRASQYLELFDYRRTTDAEGQPQQVLNMRFAESSVNQLLLRLGLPYWPLNRPKTLLWVVVDTPEAGRRLSNDPTQPAIAELLQVAAARGVPVMLPLLDLDDQFALLPDQVWNADEQAVLNASERYSAEAVLVGRMAQSSSGGWLSAWQFFHKGAGRAYDSRSESLVETAAAAIHPLADYLAALYAVRVNGDSSAPLLAQVDGVASFAAYDQLRTYLAKQAIISRAELVRIDGDTVWLELALAGSLTQLQNALTLDGVLAIAQWSEYANAPWLLASLGSAATPLPLIWQGRN